MKMIVHRGQRVPSRLAQERFRNYFASVNGQTGQSTGNQIDCLAGIGAALGNFENRLWEMRNGYALATQSGLVEIEQRLRAADEDELDELRQLLRIGVQWNTKSRSTAANIWFHNHIVLLCQLHIPIIPRIIGQNSRG